jgi:hypothetical protein
MAPHNVLRKSDFSACVDLSDMQVVVQCRGGIVKKGVIGGLESRDQEGMTR